MDDIQHITMPVRDWQLIDATVDNTVAVAAVDGDDDRVATGRRVRRTGWAASAAHPHVDDGSLGWPPPDAFLSVGLRLADWSFVLAELEGWAAVSERVGLTEEPDDSARIERFLRARLAGL
ncbi:hypothetical protein Cch01nite_13620 [Cellulomonas chitinilytica]|uniref:Uncharacterized protein n=1 Tax=Cellulomonas chitinilytica TaxID=398759 RepID=A0A919P2E7_9CELL|nr:hypothetical protein [Cellulomonas chitinilytica]GIG20638.1 hypothetical protein Cch01nite_13620 [Cellulomonas chitinilytica]